MRTVKNDARLLWLSYKVLPCPGKSRKNKTISSSIKGHSVRLYFNFVNSTNGSMVVITVETLDNEMRQTFLVYDRTRVLNLL